jgi:CheY-like chemotaxis protein
MPTLSHKSILFIDDDPAILQTVGDRLQFEGFAVTKATSGEGALAALNKMSPDLIILDISMPGMGGIKFLRDISDPHGRPHHPVLVFTARSNMEEYFSTINMDGFVSKSDDPDKLLFEIKRIIHSAHVTISHANRSDIPPTLPRRIILVGTDDPVFHQSISHLLKDAGFEVVVMETGPKVVEVALTIHPEVVLLKLIFPGMNGGAVASMLADILNHNLMPVVLFDDSGLEDHERLFRGVWRFVPSGVPATLAAVVQEAARLHVKLP